MSSISIAKHKPGFYENAVLQALGKMQEGFLQLDLPNGENLEIGHRHAHIKAKIVVKDNLDRKSVV